VSKEAALQALAAALAVVLLALLSRERRADYKRAAIAGLQLESQNKGAAA